MVGQVEPHFKDGIQNSYRSFIMGLFLGVTGNPMFYTCYN